VNVDELRNVRKEIEHQCLHPSRIDADDVMRQLRNAIDALLPPDSPAVTPPAKTKDWADAKAQQIAGEWNRDDSGIVSIEIAIADALRAAEKEHRAQFKAEAVEWMRNEGMRHSADMFEEGFSGVR
jgi:hypothetical protein